MTKLLAAALALALAVLLAAVPAAAGPCTVPPPGSADGWCSD